MHREDAHIQVYTHNVSPGTGHTWEKADSSALIELDYCCSPTAETNGCWLPNELLPHTARLPVEQGPPRSLGRLQRSPAELEMHNYVACTPSFSRQVVDKRSRSKARK